MKITYFHGVKTNDTKFSHSVYRLCTMWKLPSFLARTLTSGTNGLPLLPDMAEGKVVGCALEGDLEMFLRRLFFQVVALNQLLRFAHIASGRVLDCLYLVYVCTIYTIAHGINVQEVSECMCLEIVGYRYIQDTEFTGLVATLLLQTWKSM